MNRILKFRAWDKKDQYMDDDFYLHSENGIYNYPRVTYNTPNVEIERCDNLEVMQFVMRNGYDQDIYEGDIVKGKYWRKGEDHRFIGKVEFICGCFKVVGINQYAGAHQELDGNYEVIGNIFENPEYLTK